ncbi:hypothetical protein [Acaryochloris sp. IP29b_bin.148]|uniref:hypothetical protein n=1 Tax=Acaryochloris sp. IP29b_bin.148 TaxID=2969218 RepID=UPI0026231153|nr:hypothetical protein [Acaryochloris sp. IP29b_bin.148]
MASISKDAIEPALRKKDWLQGVEPLATVMVLMGAIATIATQKVGLVAAPLSLSILLNLRNRQQLDQLSGHYAALRVAKIQLYLQKDLQSIQYQLLERVQEGHPADLKDLQRDLAALTDQVAALEETGENADPLPLTDLQAMMNTLQTQALQCGQSLTILIQDLHNRSALTPPPLAELKATIRHQLAQQPASSGWDAARAELRQTWLTDLSALQAQVQSLAPQIAPFPQPGSVVLSSEQARLLQDQISDLYHQMTLKQAEWSAQLQLRRDGQPLLQKNLQHWQTQLTQLQTEMTRKQPLRLGALSLAAVIDQIEVALAPLQVQLVTLENQLDHLDFETQMTQHRSQQLQSLHQQLLAIHQQALLITKVV